MEVFFNNKLHSVLGSGLKGDEIREFINKKLSLSSESYYLLNNGKRVEDDIIENGSVYIIPRIFGGKGGFGSMLRAIGAQIEKTTNREACRDLSGRRLRDINEEQRLKNWINQQAEREKEAKERKKRKLERLCEKPRHEFKDEVYDKERSELPEKIEDAVLQGLQASCSGKRKHVDKKEVVKKKKSKLWVDDELDDLSSSGSENESDSEDDKVSKVSKDSKSPETETSRSSTESTSSKDNTAYGSEKPIMESGEENKDRSESIPASETLSETPVDDIANNTKSDNEKDQLMLNNQKTCD